MKTTARPPEEPSIPDKRGVSAEVPTTLGVDETRQRAHPNAGPLNPRDDARADLGEDLLSLPRGTRGRPNQSPALRGQRGTEAPEAEPRVPRGRRALLAAQRRRDPGITICMQTDESDSTACMGTAVVLCKTKDRRDL